MGFFSDFFGGGGEELEQLPEPKIKETPWGPEARGFIQNLIRREFNNPRLAIAPLSGAEQQGQSLLNQVLAGQAFQDPTTSPLYRSFRQASRREEDDAAQALRQRSQVGGVLNSSRSFEAEGDLRRDFANQRQGYLAQLFDRERQRDNPYTQLAAAQQFGSLPREIQQQENVAEFNQATQENANQIQQAQLAQLLLQYQPWYQPQFVAKQKAPGLGFSAINSFLGGVSPF